MSPSAVGSRSPKRRTRLFASITLLPVFICLFFASPVPARAEDRQCVKKVAPVYPEMARRLHIAGSIRVTATVDSTGAVVKAESNSPNKLLVQAAIDAVKHWKFATGDGTETVIVLINFEAV